MAVIPMSSSILVTNCEVIGVGLTRLNRLLANSRDTIYTTGQHQTTPVHRSRLWQVIDYSNPHMIASSNMDDRAWHGSVESISKHRLQAFHRRPHNLLSSQRKVLDTISVQHIFCRLVPITLSRCRYIRRRCCSAGATH